MSIKVLIIIRKSVEPKIEIPLVKRNCGCGNPAFVPVLEFFDNYLDIYHYKHKFTIPNVPFLAFLPAGIERSAYNIEQLKLIQNIY